MKVANLLCLWMVAVPVMALPNAEVPALPDEEAAASAPADEEGWKEPASSAAAPALGDEERPAPPLALGGAAAGLAVATMLGLALPVGLAAAGVLTVVNVMFLAGGWAPTPAESVQLVVTPLNSLVIFWMWTFAFVGVPLSALLAPPLVMLAAFYLAAVRLPWLPVVGAMVVPRLLGCLGGSCLALGLTAVVGMVAGIVVDVDSTRRGLSPAQQNAHPARIVMAALDACICPVGVLGGTLAGDMVGIALLKPITDHLGATRQQDDKVPLDLLEARPTPPANDEEDGGDEDE